MTDRVSNNPADYIMPLSINKLDGRMMFIPAPKGKSRDFLIIAGPHGMLERWWSLAENFADYGSVTMPDLPGFGGMDSFETIGIKTNLDTYADYLAAFMKLRVKRKKVTLVGVSYGFAVITRMLQKYPGLSKKVDLIVSEAGYTHKDDFIYSPLKRRFHRSAASVLAIKPVVLIERVFFINRSVVKFVDARSPSSKLSTPKLTNEEKEAVLDFKTRLWQVNDLRANFLTVRELLNIDNCNIQIDLPVIQVVNPADPFLDNDIVKQHMLIVFSSYKSYLMRKNSHALSVIADKKAAGAMIPPALRKQLLKSK